MFHAAEFEVVLATGHVPLADVSRLLTREVVDGVLDLTLEWFWRLAAQLATSREGRRA